MNYKLAWSLFALVASADGLAWTVWALARPGRSR